MGKSILLFENDSPVWMGLMKASSEPCPAGQSRGWRQQSPAWGSGPAGAQLPSLPGWTAPALSVTAGNGFKSEQCSRSEGRQLR